MSSKDVTTMTYDEARAKLSNDVYKAALLFERLEGAGKIRGNGHHMAQSIAEKATKLLTQRWEWKLP